MSTAINTKENLDEIKKKIQEEKMDFKDVVKSLKIPPSKSAILNLSKAHLLMHNALIFHKGSSLSSSQRKMVIERVAYGINKNRIKPEEVSYEINKLNAFIQGELVKQLKNVDSSD
jgi:hypothetical protein